MANPTSFVKNSTYSIFKCIVLVAATNQAKNGFDIGELLSWEDTFLNLKWDDPDAVAAINCATGTLVDITYEGKTSKVWRIHDKTRINIIDTNGYAEIIYESGWFKPNTDYGKPWNRNKDGSRRQITLNDYGFDTYQVTKKCS